MAISETLTAKQRELLLSTYRTRGSKEDYVNVLTAALEAFETNPTASVYNISEDLPGRQDGTVKLAMTTAIKEADKAKTNGEPNVSTLVRLIHIDADKSKQLEMPEGVYLFRA